MLVAEMDRLWLERASRAKVLQQRLYQLRRQNLYNIKKRGRWLALSNVRRYAKDCHVQKLLEMLSTEPLLFTKVVAYHLNRILNGTTTVSCVPLLQ
jgi:hypothetical protein